MIFCLVLAILIGNDVEAENKTDECQFTIIKPSSFVNSSYEYNGSASSDFTCGWKVEIPDDQFVILYLSTSVSNGSVLRLSQSEASRESVEEFTSTYVEKAFFFISPGFDIQLITNNLSSRVGKVDVIWQKHDENVTTKTYNVSKNEAAVVLNHDDTYNPVVIHGETRISILATLGLRADEVEYLRATIVFDGPTVKSPFLGSLFTIANSTTQLVSTNSSVTIVSLLPKMTEHHVIFQDYSNSQNYSNFNVVRITEGKTKTIRMNATKIDGKTIPNVVFTELGSLVESEYLKSVELEEGSELRVYIDGLAESQRIATYKFVHPSLNLAVSSTSNNRTHLPQKFHSSIRFYVLTSGSATITLTRNVDDAKWMQPFDGRQGFVTSSFFKNSKNRNNAQDSFHFIGFENGLENNGTKFMFSYKIEDVDISENCSLHVVITDYQEKVNYYDHRDALTTDSFPIDTWISRKGQSISFLYSTNKCQCLGYYGEFKFSKSSEKFNFYQYVVMATTLFFGWIF